MVGVAQVLVAMMTFTYQNIFILTFVLQLTIDGTVRGHLH